MYTFMVLCEAHSIAVVEHGEEFQDSGVHGFYCTQIGPWKNSTEKFFFISPNNFLLCIGHVKKIEASIMFLFFTINFYKIWLRLIDE